MTAKEVYELFRGKLPVDNNGNEYVLIHLNGDESWNYFFNLVPISLADLEEVNNILN